MFENLISKILRIERESIPNRQEIVIAPDVIYHPHLFLKIRERHRSAPKEKWRCFQNLSPY